MAEEQKVTIKVNHCIEISSPVNFHMLRNNTKVPGRQEQMEIARLYHLSYARLKQLDEFIIPE